VPRPAMTDDPDLHVRVGTRRIDPAAVQNGRCTFVLPPSGAQVMLACRAARPNAARPWIADDRRLGAMVRRLVHRNGSDRRDVATDDPALEQAGGRSRAAQAGRVAGPRVMRCCRCSARACWKWSYPRRCGTRPCTLFPPRTRGQCGRRPSGICGAPNRCLKRAMRRKPHDAPQAYRPSALMSPSIRLDHQ
jgi:hypothetical protein